MNRLLLILFCVLASNGCIKGASFRDLNDNHSDHVVWSCTSEEKFDSAWRCRSEDSHVGSQEKFRDNVKSEFKSQAASPRFVLQEEHLGGTFPEIVWTIQLGAYASRDAALKHWEEYVSESGSLWLTNSVKQRGVLTLLLYGKFENRQLAQAAASELQQLHPTLEYWVRMIKIDR
tara:strand:- start:2196 stop:2720 length:525 start_codon:yes stop_codon:yes gene_type:complete